MASDQQIAPRLEALREVLVEHELDAYLATSEASIAYLSGYWGLQLERFFGVVVPVDGRPTLLVPELESDAVAGATSLLDHVLWAVGTDALEVLDGLLAGTQRIGVDETDLPLGRARRLENGRDLVAAAGLLSTMRIEKDAEERDAIAASCTKIGLAYEALFDRLRPGVVEREINAEIEYRLRRSGATDCTALVLFGAHAADPHGSPDDRSLRPGDVVCADLSAQFDGYWGDLTRCATAGPATEWARRSWDVVVRAQAAAIEASVVGATADDVDAAQRAIVTAAEDLGSCLHGAGHGIGTEIHEPPFLVAGSDVELIDGTVVTIEPGIYRSGIGGLRLEDDVVVSGGRPIVLSKEIPDELKELPVH
jgi:Xaa-Pro dipeptidase